jgi:steroid delta-isomerase-like uncharacterized protein
MPATDNKAAVQRFYDQVINNRNLDVIPELVTADSVDHTWAGQGVEASKQFFGMLYQAFPDLHVEVEAVIAEGDLVAVRATYSGTHQGPFVGIPPTGKSATVTSVDFFRMDGGKQAEHWGGPDTMSLMQQLGVMQGSGPQR